MAARVRHIHSPVQWVDLPPAQIRGNPLQLVPVPWGQPDAALGKALCQHLVDATPPLVISFNPLKNASLRRALRSYGIHH